MTSFISFWSYFYFYWTGASCVMSSTILQLVTWSCHLGALRWLDSPPGSTHTFLNLPHFSLGIFGRTRVTKKWLLATPLTHVPYIYGALFCPSLLFDLDNFIYRIILGLCSTCRIQINTHLDSLKRICVGLFCFVCACMCVCVCVVLFSF